MHKHHLCLKITVKRKAIIFHRDMFGLQVTELLRIYDPMRIVFKITLALHVCDSLYVQYHYYARSISSVWQKNTDDK